MVVSGIMDVPKMFSGGNYVVSDDDQDNYHVEYKGQRYNLDALDLFDVGETTFDVPEDDVLVGWNSLPLGLWYPDEYYSDMKSNYDTNYCDRVAEGQTRSCQDLAAQESYRAKAAENPAPPIYSKYYKRYAARVRSRQIKEADFKKWKFQALAKRDECSNGKITVEEYIAWTESYFPNRTPKT